LKVLIFIFIEVQSINIKNIIIWGTKIIIFIIIESINTKNSIICGINIIICGINIFLLLYLEVLILKIILFVF
jgi:hypothetical protein